MLDNQKVDYFIEQEFNPKYAGIATPFGIRMYNAWGYTGTSNWNLFVYGAVVAIIVSWMSTVLFVINAILKAKFGFVIEEQFSTALQLILFMLMFRFTPISSIHASEHQVIHALEKGLTLDQDTVRQQSRIHPRCGTQFVALIVVMLITSSILSFAHLNFYLDFFITIVVGAALKDFVGNLFQKYLTTKEARDIDIDNAIKLGLELNTKMVKSIQNSEIPQNNFKAFWMQIKHSGDIYTIGGILFVFLSKLLFSSMM